MAKVLVEAKATGIAAAGPKKIRADTAAKTKKIGNALTLRRYLFLRMSRTALTNSGLD